MVDTAITRRDIPQARMHETVRMRIHVASACAQGDLLLALGLGSAWIWRKQVRRTGWRRPPYAHAVWVCRGLLALHVLLAALVAVFWRGLYADPNASYPVQRNVYDAIRWGWWSLWWGLLLGGGAWCALAAWRIRPLCRLQRQGVPLCPTCGYRIIGLVSPRCPECGTSIPGAPVRTVPSQPKDETKR